MSKRLKSNNMTGRDTERIIPFENNLIQPPLPDFNQTIKDPYHESICGSILLPLPTNSPSEVFSYLRHGKFDRFQRCLEVYHKEIIQMKNEYEQTVLHVLTIHAYPYQWVRLLLMRGCDPCVQDHDGYTPIHYAIERDDIEMLKALTTRFCSDIRLFSDKEITTIHNNCLKSISIRQKQGLTGFMLACYQQSNKCLNYLLELQINDVDLRDIYGDTCLHYAVSRRNKNLVEQLINACNANVNAGDHTRPSPLDILQFNREKQKPFDKEIDDSIEHILLSHHAINRCQIRRITNKRKELNDNDESVVANLACLTVDSQIRTARNYARLGLSSEKNGDISHSQEYYQQAMNSVPNDTLDWADYALKIAIIHITHGENQLALNVLQQALTIRKRFENETDEISQIQRAIDHLQRQILI